ncbi:MAG: carboxypeptidase-like regulatory domain-containing protein [Rudaea sp.]
MRVLRRHISVAFVTASMLMLCACVAAPVQPGSGRHVSNRELTMEKTGRVVDADTGAGIPGVQVIVNWQTQSSGIPGYSSTGGTWCDLQKIVTTDANGTYTIPDVSKELDLSDRGTRIGKTPYGLASATHDKNYTLAVFKRGYIGVEDLPKVKEFEDLANRNLIGGPSLDTIPDVNFHGGKTEIKTITMRKVNLNWSDLWAYYSIIPLGCSSRDAHAIEAPEAAAITNANRTTVKHMPCSMPPETVINPAEFSNYWHLFDMPGNTLKFYFRVKAIQGLPTSRYGYDPTERITTSAGVLCQALREVGGEK